VSASGEMVEVRTGPAITEAVEKVSAEIDFSGTRALRILLHTGISALWPAIKAAPERQVRTYEATVAALRRRWEDRVGCGEEPAVSGAFRDQDAEIGAFLRLCADRSHTEWIEPVEAIAAYTVAVMQGTVLRWLADCNDETTLIVLDDLVSSLTTRAVDK
jgi:hypothetical protein